MKGVIRSTGTYSDGKENFEIRLDSIEEFPRLYNDRFIYILVVDKNRFISGVRITEKNGAWLCPDLYTTNNKAKIRLSEVLINHGFRRNEEVDITLDTSKKVIQIKKISL
jgi:hypothetical protein